MLERDEWFAALDLDEHQLDVKWPPAGLQERDEAPVRRTARGGLTVRAAPVAETVFPARELIYPEVEVHSVGAIG
jgi:hypothetical protein